MSDRRLSICYLVPGHRLLPSAGPTRNVLSLAGALGRVADVTVAFADASSREVDGPFEVREIDPGRRPRRKGTPSDDAALRGVGYRDFLRYMRALRTFVKVTATEFDVVLEKGWLLSGYASARYAAAGGLGIPVENLVQVRSSTGRADVASRARHALGRRAAAGYLRRAPRVIAETESLRRALSRAFRLSEDRVDVIELGVEPELFHPRDRNASRRELGLGLDQRVLLYAGVLDRIHDLGPVLRGLGAVPEARLVLVGDGPCRDEYEALARAAGIGDRVEFRGRVPHEAVPTFVAAADVCLAPYDPSAFFEGEVAYSTLKIREFLAAGRPVVSVRSGSIPALVEEGVTGWLVDHTDRGWRAALAGLPDPERLAAMGRRACARPPRDWNAVARDYLAVCARALGGADPS